MIDRRHNETGKDTMGEHKKIVIEHYPVDKLPEELRRGLEAGAVVTITMESEQGPRPKRSIVELFGKGGRVHTDPVADIRKLRDEWDD